MNTPTMLDAPADPDAGFGELRSGTLGVRIATTAAEIDAAQALRYRICYEEMGAHPDDATRATHRDRDRCDVGVGFAERVTKRYAHRGGK